MEFEKELEMLINEHSKENAKDLLQNRRDVEVRIVKYRR
jgi:hypothetical protein